MKIGFIKKYKVPIIFIGVGILLLIFSFALPTKRSFVGEKGKPTISKKVGRQMSSKKEKAKEASSKRIKKFIKKRGIMDQKRAAEIYSIAMQIPVVIVVVDNKPLGEPREIQVEPQEVDVTSEATVSASPPHYPGMPPTNATDGNPGTEWASHGDRSGLNPWIMLSWRTQKTIKYVTLRDRVNPVDHITSGQLLFSDGSSVPVGELPNDSSPLAIEFPLRTITWVKFQVTSTAPGTQNPGLAEFVVIGMIQPPPQVIPSQSLYQMTRDRVEEYCQDIANYSKYVVILHPSQETTPDSLKSYLYDRHRSPAQPINPPDRVFVPSRVNLEQDAGYLKLIGAVFIGDIPVAKLEFGDAPCDHYFMDLIGGVWRMGVSGYVIDVAYREITDLYPEIWLGRFPTYDLINPQDKVKWVRQFLTKCHQIKQGANEGRTPRGKALLFVDDPFAEIETPGIRYLFQPHNIHDFRYFRRPQSFSHIRQGMDITTVSAFLDMIKEQTRQPVDPQDSTEYKYFWLDLTADGLPNEIWVYEDFRFKSSIYDSTIKNTQLTPRYIILRGPGFCNFIHRGFVAGGFLYGDKSSGLVCIGTTVGANYGGTYLSYEPFYYALRRTRNIGQAYLALIRTAIKYSDNPLNRVALGFTLLGDPTLRAYGIDNVDLNHAKGFVAKGITGGDHSLPDLSVRNIYLNYDVRQGGFYVCFEWDYKDPSLCKIDIDTEGFLFYDRPGMVALPESLSYTISVDDNLPVNNVLVDINRPYAVSVENVKPTDLFIPEYNDWYTIKVVIDPDNIIPERNENNNELEESLYAGRAVDLVIPRIGFYKEDLFKRTERNLWVNERNKFWVRIENNGDYPGRRETVDCYLKRGLNTVSIEEQIQIDWYSLRPNIQYGERGKIYTLKPSKLIRDYHLYRQAYRPGSEHLFRIEIDSRNEIVEDREGNNIKEDYLLLPF